MPRLTQPKDEVRLKLRQRIEKGHELLRVPSDAAPDVELLRENRSKWVDFTYGILLRCFDDPAIATEFRNTQQKNTPEEKPYRDEVAILYQQIANSITSLESLFDQLDLFEQNNKPKASPIPQADESPETGKVFIVHGHNEAILAQAARFIQQLGLTAIILHEQANRGKTIIEKIEEYSTVNFCIILLTGDDIGYKKSDPSNFAARARQNVILELGYFIGKIGRSKVCALYESGVELPSDMLGVVYVEINSFGSWKTEVAREMKAAGLNVDFNLIL
jgi:predicted nucleotide-binding protein